MCARFVSLEGLAGEGPQTRKGGPGDSGKMRCLVFPRDLLEGSRQKMAKGSLQGNEVQVDRHIGARDSLVSKLQGNLTREPLRGR
eukprot:3161928-Pyramimonas_sp.AAC.1